MLSTLRLHHYCSFTAARRFSRRPRTPHMSACACAPPQASPPPSVVVVGAGFAGLSAARELQRSSAAQVVVLEAGQRVGGRAWSHRLEGLSLEMGATWIHGLGSEEDPNPIWSLALEQGLMRSDPQLYVTEWWESEWLLPGRSTALSEEETLVVHKVVKAFAGALEALEPSMEGSVARQLQGTKEEVLSNVPVEHLDLVQRAWRWRELLQGAIDGSPSMEQTRAAFLAYYDDFDGPFAAIPCGYQGLAEALASGLDIRLGQEVEHIEYGLGGVRVSCTSGAVFEGAAAVVTVSLGVLKAQHHSLFSPPLPPRTVQAIERIQIGVVDKIFVNLAPSASSAAAAAAAPPDGDAVDPPMECSSGEERDNHNVVSYALLWPPESQPGGAAQQQQPGQPAEASPSPAWARGLYTLRFGGPEFKRLQRGQHLDAAGVGGAQLAGQQSGPVPEEWAVLWISGEEALAMECSSDEEVLAAVRGLLLAFPAAQRLPSSWDLGPGTTGGAVVRSCWGTDPRFAGSYCFLGLEAGPEDVEALAEPVWVSTPQAAAAAAQRGAQAENEAAGSANGSQQRPVVLFAGEAQHVTYMGCTHAAFLSGRRQAQQLLQHLTSSHS